MSVPQGPTPEQLMQIVLPLLGPNGPFAVGQDERGKFFVHAAKTLGHYYLQQMPQFFDNTFLVFEKERYTYKQTWNITKGLNHVLKTKFGLQKGDRVAITLRNYPEWCFAFLGATVSGIIAVPINSWWGTTELKYGFTDSGSKVVVCDYTRFSSIKSFIDELNIQVIVVRSNGREINHKNVHRFEDLLASVNAEAIPDDSVIDQTVQENDDAVIMYTSGTTGLPKGVIQTHKGITNQLKSGDFYTTVQLKVAQLPGMPPLPNVSQHAIVCAVPLFHSTATHHIFLPSLNNGRKLVFMFKWDAEEALKIIQTEKITHWTGVPTMLLDLMEHPKFSQYDTSSLVALGAGGAPTPPSQVIRTKQTFKSGFPTNAYGLTETNGAVTVNSSLNYLRKPSSVGLAMPIVELKVVDLDSGEDVGLNKRGEILIKSSLNMRGYWNKPEATAKVLSPDNWFKSGDVGVIDDEGFVYIVDRAKDIIIRGGENISSAEVETAFYTHPAVRECAVFGLPDERLGEVVAIMIYNRSPVTSTELLNHVKDSLAAFKIPPASNVFFTNEALPRGGTGKIQKREIRDRVLASLKPTSKL